MRKLALGLALSSVLASHAHAVGLGEIRTSSSLNQPLSANIELVETSPSDIDDIQVTLAPNEVFEQVGIARSRVLDLLEFVPTMDNGVPVIKVVSLQPIQEPFLNFVLEVTWANGKLLREYTVLLDPPVFSDSQYAAAPVIQEAAPVPAFVPAPAMEVETAELFEMDRVVGAPVADVGVPVATSRDIFPELEGLDPFVTVPAPTPRGEAIGVADAFLYDGLETFPVEGSVAAPLPVEELDLAAINEVIARPEQSGSLPTFVDGGLSDADLVQAAPDAVFNQIPAEQWRTPEDETFAVADLIAGTEPIFVAQAPTPSAREAEIDSLFAERPVAASTVRLGSDSYRVRRGETLGQIARRVGGAQNLNQTMLALLRANPDAFINGNINLVRSGYVLRVPSREDIASIAPSEALAEVNRQVAAWREYRSTIAKVATPQLASDRLAGIEDLEFRATGGVLDSSAIATPLPPAVTAGDVVPAEVADLARSRNDLEILVPEGSGDSVEGTVTTGTGSIGNIERELAFAKEQLESQSQQNAELRSRVAELESLLESKNRLIELKNEQLAELQSQLDPAAQAASQAATGLGEQALDTATDSAQAVAETAEGVLPRVESESEASPTEQLAQAETEAAANSTRIEESKAPEAQVSRTEDNLVDDVKNNPNLLMGLGFGGLLLAALAWLLLRRKDEERVTPVVATPTMPAEKPLEPVFGKPVVEKANFVAPAVADEPLINLDATGEGRIPEGLRDLELDAVATESGIAISGLEASETSAEDDEVLSEANVYLAYGLPEQAIDLLKPHVDAGATRPGYGLKLLEAYHATGRKDEFVALAEKLKPQVGDGGARSADWAKIALMGKDLVPASALFAGVDTTDLTMTQVLSKPPSIPDIELTQESEDSGDIQGLHGNRFNATQQVQSPELDEFEIESELDLVEPDKVGEFRIGDLGDLDDMDQFGDRQSETLDRSAKSRFDDDTLVKDGLGDIDDINLDDIGLGGEDELVEPSEMLNVAQKRFERDNTALEIEDELNLDTLVGDSDVGDLFSTGEDEISTKLDLAKAYLDMGDDEGAREALDEVLTLGNSEQRAEASRLKSQLD